MLWLLESGLVAIARLLLYLRLLGQVTNLFPQLTRRLSAGEPHARVRGPCAQFGGMGLEHVQQPLPVALVVPDALVVAKHALVGEDAAQPDDQMGAPLARLGVLPSHDALFARPELLHPALDVGHLLLDALGHRFLPAFRRLSIRTLDPTAGEWADSCNALLPGYAVIDHRSFKARGIERIPTIHEGYASREMEKRGGRGDLCEENRRIQALNRLLDALRAMIGRLSDQAQGILTAVKRRQRPSGAPQAPSSPEPAERPQERPQARETPPQAPQEPPKPIRTKKALTDRFKTRLDERLAENERKQAEPDMEETWDLSDPADPLNIGMGWGTGGHGLGL